MSFLGMGTVEILVVLMLAFIFLGPERMVEVARKLGKLVAEVRKMIADLPEIVMDEEPERPPRTVPEATSADPVEENKPVEASAEPDGKPPPVAEPGLGDSPNGTVPHKRVTRQKRVETPETPDIESSLDRE